MAAKCPGNSRVLSTVIITCPFCNTELEFFSDEGHRSCYVCRKIVFLDSLTACYSHCDLAEVCLEINRWIDDGKICFRKKD